MDTLQQQPAKLSHKVKSIGHLDLQGGGQVVVHGNYAFVGHMKPPHGTTVLDVSDPRSGFASPQSNDVDLDARGLIYLLDRNCGFDILEFDS